MNFHVRVVTIVLTTLLLLTAIFVWMTVLDKGTVEVTVRVAGQVAGEQAVLMNEPYELSFRGAEIKGGKTVECFNNPCAAKLPAGSYGVTVTRKGYFEEVTGAEVARGENKKIEMMLRLIPTVTEAEPYEELKTVFERENMGARFRFGMDTKYKKQRLTYRDPGDAEGRGGFDMVWTYFDRSLKSPTFFPNATLSKGLVVDRSDGATYVVRLTPSKRTWVGVFEGVEEVLWAGDPATAAQDGPWVLINMEQRLQWVKLGEEAEGVVEIREWPFKVRFDQIVAEAGGDGETGRVLFLTTADLLSLESSGGVPSTLDVVKNLLNGKIEGNKEKSTSPISLVEYTPEANRYRVLHTFTADFKLTAENSRLAYDGERWLVGNGEKAWKIEW